MATYSGNLTLKRKAEMQEIATALGISDTGTREDLQQRIKKHLEDNAPDLQDDPAFAGLYTKTMRQKSLQPQGSFGSFASQKPASARSSMAVIKERHTSPLDETQDVSMMLPSAPFSPGYPSTPSSPVRKQQLATPSSLPPLPPSPTKSIIQDALAQPEVQAVVEMERNAVRGSLQALQQTRAFLSNGRNIFILTALVDFCSILFTINKDGPYPIPPLTVQAAPAMHAMSMAVSTWAGPAIVLPVIMGFLISFSQTTSFDPLTASIVRVAANVAYEFPFLRLADVGTDGVQDTQLKSLDVLGFKWRVLTSSVTLAFAVSEAIGKMARARYTGVSSRMATPARTFTPER